MYWNYNFSTDDMKKMNGQIVHNPNQFGNAYVVSDATGIVSINSLCYLPLWIIINSIWDLLIMIMINLQCPDSGESISTCDDNDAFHHAQLACSRFRMPPFTDCHETVSMMYTVTQANLWYRIAIWFNNCTGICNSIAMFHSRLASIQTEQNDPHSDSSKPHYTIKSSLSYKGFHLCVI